MVASATRSESSVLTAAQAQSVDAFWKREAAHLANAAEGHLPWAGGRAVRDTLATKVASERADQGFLTKETFDDVVRWGFGRSSGLAGSDIEAATRDAFARLRTDDAAGAAKRLIELDGVGVSRATKILALSDQQNLGIYDSHAASALRSIRVNGDPLVPVPPGMSRALRGGPYVSQEQLALEYEKYTAVLRRLLEDAQSDPRYAESFKTVSDVERALFGRSRLSLDGQVREARLHASIYPAISAATVSAVAAATLGGLIEVPELVRGNVSPGSYAQRRLKQGALAGGSHLLGRAVGRIGGLRTGALGHLQRGGHAVLVGGIIGGAADLPALVCGDMPLRNYVENRGLDGLDGAAQYGAAAATTAALIAAPFDLPVLAAGAVTLGVGVGASFATKPLRSYVGGIQHERAARQWRVWSMNQRRRARRS